MHQLHVPKGEVACAAAARRAAKRTKCAAASNFHHKLNIGHPLSRLASSLSAVRLVGGKEAADVSLRCTNGRCWHRIGSQHIMAVFTLAPNLWAASSAC